MIRCGRCDWQPNLNLDEPPQRDQLRQHALEAQHPLCAVCARSLNQYDPAMACETCLTTTREHLSGIVTMWTELPRHLGHATAAPLGHSRGGGEEHALPGGTVLTMIGPGSNGTAPDARGGRDHIIDNTPTDPSAIAWTLETWAQDWYEQRGWTDDMPAPKVPALAGYLEVHARWAANNHGAFSEFADELRKLHLTLEVVDQRRRLAVRAQASCFDCGGTLRRLVDSDGFEQDFVTCDRCHETYDQARYLLACAARREHGLSGWVTIAAAVSASKRTKATLQVWLADPIPWACQIEPRMPTEDNPKPWRMVSQIVWYPAVDEKARTAERRLRATA